MFWLLISFLFSSVDLEIKMMEDKMTKRRGFWFYWGGGKDAKWNFWANIWRGCGSCLCRDLGCVFEEDDDGMDGDEGDSPFSSSFVSFIDYDEQGTRVDEMTVDFRPIKIKLETHVKLIAYF